MQPPSEPGPSRSPADDHPYDAPQADIRLAPVGKPPGVDDERARWFLKIGLVLCSGWPLLFGTFASTGGGRLGMVLAFAVVTAGGISATGRSDRLFPALSYGSFALGILSLVPVLPVMLGGMLIGLVTRMVPAEAMPLGFLAAGIVTLLYGAAYIVSALAIGTIILGLRRR